MKTVEAPFQVDFENKDIAPKKPVVFDELIDWRNSTDEQIKYYSGTAVYSSTFNMDKLPKNQDVYINLGTSFGNGKSETERKIYGRCVDGTLPIKCN